MSADRPCCAVARRPDAAEIDAALRAGGPLGSVRRVAARFGLSRTAVSEHRACLGLRDASTGQGSTVEESTPDSSPRSTAHPAAHATDTTPDSARTPPDSGADRADTSAPTSPPVPTPYVTRARATQSARQLPTAPAPPSVEDQQRVTAERIRVIANLIAIASWKNRTHIQGFAQRWGCSEEDVRRLHARASLTVKADRGTLAGQRELSVARVEKIRDDELAAAAKYEQAAEDAYRQAAEAPPGRMSTAPARLAKTLAGMARTTALAAEKYLASITFQRPKDPHQVLNVNFSTHPDFVKAAEIQRLILDTIAPPGLAARLDEAFGVWEQGGDAALEEWRREQLEAGSLLLTQGEDGSFREAATG